MRARGYVPRWGKGYIPDRGDTRANLRAWSSVRVGQAIVREAVASLPLPPGFVAMDQGITNTCVPHARSAATVLRVYAATGAVIEPPAVLPWYALTRMQDAIGNNAPLVDLGCRPTTCTRVASDWGVVPSSAYPFDPAKVNDRPDFEILEAAAERRIAGHYAIDAGGVDRLAEIRRALGLGFPVPIALQIASSEFESAPPNITIQKPSASPDAIHEVLVVGVIPGAFFVLNSWGPLWCENGFAAISEDYVADDALCIDADVVTLDGDAERLRAA